MNQVPQFATPDVSLHWSYSRNTHPAVAMAIHAIASPDRTPEAIWEMPTYTEWDCVTSAVENYISCGVFTAEPSGRYPWGGEWISVFLPPSETHVALEQLLESASSACGTFDTLHERVAACTRYADELNRIELPPNGDDFNALLELLAGKPYRPPSAKGR